MKRNTGMAVVAAGIMTMAGCGAVGAVGSSTDTSSTASESTTATASSSTTEDATAIEQAARHCLLGRTSADEGKSLTFDTRGDEDYGPDEEYDLVEDVACVLYQLDVPDYVVQHIDSTRALDGQQTDTWDDFEARWSYHPDSGMQLTVIDRS